MWDLEGEVNNYSIIAESQLIWAIGDDWGSMSYSYWTRRGWKILVYVFGLVEVNHRIIWGSLEVNL